MANRKSAANGKKRRKRAAPIALPGSAKPVFKPPATTNFIRQWRAFRGIDTQGELARLTGITRATISRLEDGSLEYRQKQLVALGKALRCTPADLLDTDPFKTGEIFTIYQRLAGPDKAAVERMISAYNPRTDA